MLDEIEKKVIPGKNCDFHIYDPVKIRFSGRSPTEKRRNIAKTLFSLFKKSNLIHSPTVTGSTSYGAAHDGSDVDILALTRSKRPFEAYIPIQHPSTGEEVAVALFAYPKNDDTLKYSFNTWSALKEIPQNHDMWAVGVPNIFRTDSELHACASTGVIDQVRGAAKLLLEQGVSTISPKELATKIIEMQWQVNQNLGHNDRWKRGLGRVVERNVSDAMSLLPYFIPVKGSKKAGIACFRPSRKYRISDSLKNLPITSWPSPSQLKKRDEIHDFREKIVFPALRERWSSKNVRVSV